MWPMVANLMQGAGKRPQYETQAQITMMQTMLQSLSNGVGGASSLGKGGGKQQQHFQQPAAKRLKTAPGPAPTVSGLGQFVTGTIKSYNADKRYGFITAPELPNDAFFMMTDLPDYLQNSHG